MKSTKKDFQLSIKSLVNSIGLKIKYVEKSTQTTNEVCLHIPGVRVISGLHLE